jgi:ferric-dicitrate binding protein FerR (iron transport regulator)
MRSADASGDRKLLWISALVGRNVGGDLSQEGHREGRERITQAVAEQHPRRRRMPRVAWTIGAAALALVLAGATGRWALRGEKRLDYSVSGGSVSVGGYVLGAGAGSTATLRFSDGTEINLAEGARARIAAVSARGARLALESGHATLRVADRPNAEWAVDAGPFVVRALGTEFDVDWSGIDGTLEVELKKGTLVLNGPPAPGGLTLRSGQRLVAQHDHLRVETLGAPNTARSVEILRDLELGADGESAAGLDVSAASPSASASAER